MGVLIPGQKALWISSIRREFRRDSAIIAEVIAGVELTPEATIRPAPAGLFVEPADARDEIARVREVQIMGPGLYAVLGHLVIDSLEGAAA